MEMKTCVILAFLLLASCLKPLSARNLEVEVSDGLKEVVQLPLTKENQVATGGGKSSWPDLVGTNGLLAKEFIELENPNVRAIIIPPWVTVLPLDYNFGRVRVFVDWSYIVTRVPVIG